MKYEISFSDGGSVRVDEGSNLSEVLNIQNSPILFGCRTGICGTCLVNVREGMENLSEIGSDEIEYLEIIANTIANPRLACQLLVKGDVKLEYLGKS